MRLTPTWPAHLAVSRVPAPHQTRRSKLGECGRTGIDEPGLYMCGYCFSAEVEGVFVTHVDDSGADLYVLGAGGDRGEQGHGGGLLGCEVVHAEVGAVDT